MKNYKMVIQYEGKSTMQTVNDIEIIEVGKGTITAKQTQEVMDKKQ